MATHEAEHKTTLTLRKRRGMYVIDAEGYSDASLRASWHMRNGVITTADGSWPVRAHDFGRCEVTAGPEGAPLVRLNPPQALIARQDHPARWEIGRNFRQYHGILSYGDQRIVVRQPAFSGRPVHIDISGSWPREELLVLTVCFAVMSRRRGDNLRIIAVVGATGGR